MSTDKAKSGSPLGCLCVLAAVVCGGVGFGSMPPGYGRWILVGMAAVLMALALVVSIFDDAATETKTAELYERATTLARNGAEPFDRDVLAYLADLDRQSQHQFCEGVVEAALEGGRKLNAVAATRLLREYVERIDRAGIASRLKKLSFLDELREHTDALRRLSKAERREVLQAIAPDLSDGEADEAAAEYLA